MHTTHALFYINVRHVGVTTLQIYNPILLQRYTDCDISYYWILEISVVKTRKKKSFDTLLHNYI